jgi:hypothetical protein
MPSQYSNVFYLLLLALFTLTLCYMEGHCLYASLVLIMLAIDYYQYHRPGRHKVSYLSFWLPRKEDEQEATVSGVNV